MDVYVIDTCQVVLEAARKHCDFCGIELSTEKIDHLGNFLLSNGWADSLELYLQTASNSGAMQCYVIADLALYIG